MTPLQLYTLHAFQVKQ